MAFCNNCGSKIEGNDLFCPNCGTKVNQTSNENQKQNQNQSQNQSQNRERVEQAFEQVKSVTNQINFAEIINTLKASALNPVSGGKQFISKAEKNDVIIIALFLTILQGILGIWRISQIISSLQAITSKFFQNIYSLTSLFGGSSSSFSSGDLAYLSKTINQFKSSISIPYGKIFIQNCALYLIGVFILFILIYLGINILAKIKCTPFIIFKTVLITTIPILVFEIISIILSYFSLYLGIGIVILGALISFSTLLIIVKDTFQINENLCILIVSISSLIAFAAFFIVLQNFISSDLSDIVSSTINSIRNPFF